jgi:hypothetical protein
LLNKTITIVDDDGVVLTDDGDIRSMPYTLLGVTPRIRQAFGEAYMTPVEAPSIYTDTDVPFKRNLAIQFAGNWSRQDLSDTTDFWVIYLVAAWQGLVAEDGDPHTATYSRTYGEAFDANNRGAIYVESLRELEGGLPGVPPRYFEENTIMHEIGHIGGVRGEGDGGLMDPLIAASVSNIFFTPVTIKRFRAESIY